MGRIPVTYIRKTENITIYPDKLRVNFTPEYIQSIDRSLTVKDARKVLYWLAKTYDPVVGINEGVIRKTIQGVKGGLL